MVTQSTADTREFLSKMNKIFNRSFEMSILWRNIEVDPIKISVRLSNPVPKQFI